MDWWMMLLPFAAVVLDLLLGDPRSLPHPVQAVGKIADFVEKRFRAFGATKRNGSLALCIVILVTGGVVGAGVSLPFLGAVLSLYFAYSGLALGSLLKEGDSALSAVQYGTIEEARQAVGMLVSRDTSDMNRDDLYRSLAESISENSNDGFVAPFFYLALGGPVLLWVYKAVSTLDSMWGYKNERWANFGYAAARLDDVFAYLPARLSAFFMLVAARLMLIPTAFDMRGTWNRTTEDAKLMDSPNAGWPMAMAAWIVSRRMGGITKYDGVAVNKPLLGPVTGTWDADDIRLLLKLVRISCVLGAWVLWLLALWIQAAIW
ncbi:adenosylcobinamide-phosphate synthase CbiB [Oleidesulfovibrio sp.]|uniref:adenosylcobinamide-phosphate synthase CbiB n=1 Tax=Oleidesulfovibrio sp. TaxID=2909707 RepID=UPI003A874334